MRLSSTLLATALATTSLAAVDIGDDDVKLSIGLYLQPRVEWNKASDVNAAAFGGDTFGDISNFSTAENAVESTDHLDFRLRRARLVLGGSYKTRFIFGLVLAGDNDGRTADASVNSVLYEGWTGIKVGSETTEHRLRAGRFTAFFNRGGFPSDKFLFPGDNPTAVMMAPRNVGLEYRAVTPNVTIGATVVNNHSTASAPAAFGDDAAAGNRREGLFYGTRVEVSPASMRIHPDKWMESYAGDVGRGIALGLDLGYNHQDRFGANTINTRVIGGDVLAHFDGLTAFAAFRWWRNDFDEDVETGASDKVPGYIWTAQAGYAFTVAGRFVLEPALRFSYIDLDTHNEMAGFDLYTCTAGSANFGVNDYGTSGKQLDVGLNWYINKHNNKIQLSYTRWEGEQVITSISSKSDPMASIVRLQHTLKF